MRSKVTVVLLFLNVVLFSYIWFYDKPRIDERRTLEARRRVLGPEVATISALARTSRAGETVKLEKRPDGAWSLAAPYEWPADANATSGLINSLELLEHETSFPVSGLAATGRSLADYGLAEPALTLTFTSSGRDYTLKIGDVTEVRNNLYLLSADGTRIHVVSRSFGEAIDLPLAKLRATSLFSIPVFEVRSLNVQTAAPANLKVRLRRDAASRWAFEAPINARASKSAVEATISAATNFLTARTFLEPRDTDLERAGLNSPALRVTLEGNARRETLLIGNPTGATVPREGSPDSPAAPAAAGDPEYFAKFEDKSVAFTTAIPAELMKVLRRAQEELRDPRVLDFEPATVTALTLIAADQSEISLQRLEPLATAASTPATAEEAKPGWQALVRVPGSAPQTLAADPAIIADLIKKLAQLTAREARPGSPRFLSDAPSDADKENWGFNRPERQIILTLKNPDGSASTLTLQVGISPDKPGEAFARVTNAPYVYQVLPDILDATPVAARHYRLRTLRELPEAARITGLKLTALPDGPLVFEITGEHALTREAFTADKFNEAARTVLASLLGELRKLQARSFPPGAFTPAHAETAAGPQPWKYRLDTTIILPGGTGAAQPPVVSTLYFTDRLGGTAQLAGTADFGGVVFETTQEVLDALFRLTYLEKQDPAAPPTTGPATKPAAEAPAPPQTETPAPPKR